MTVAPNPYKRPADGDAPSASEKRAAAIDFYKKRSSCARADRFPGHGRIATLSWRSACDCHACRRSAEYGLPQS